MDNTQTVIFYEYHLLGLTEPIVIEALNKNEADGFLRRNKRYIKAPIVSLHVSKPLFGVTKKTEGGITYVWCGFTNSPNGWMEEGQYKILGAGIEQ